MMTKSDQLAAYRQAVGETVRQMRTSAGMTQKELAERIPGMLQPHVCHIEHARLAVSIKRLMNLSHACGRLLTETLAIVVKKAETLLDKMP